MTVNPGAASVLRSGALRGLPGGRPLRLFGHAASLLLDPLKECRERDAERRCDARNVLETEVALAALDRAHEGPVHAAVIGEGFLRETLFGARFAYPLAQSLEKAGIKRFVHNPEFRKWMRIRLQCLHRPRLHSIL